MLLQFTLVSLLVFIVSLTQHRVTWEEWPSSERISRLISSVSLPVGHCPDFIWCSDFHMIYVPTLVDTVTFRQHEPVSKLGSNVPPWLLLQFLLAVLYITYVKTVWTWLLQSFHNLSTWYSLILGQHSHWEYCLLQNALGKDVAEFIIKFDVITRT